MEEYLQDASEQALIEAVHNNLYEFYDYLGRSLRSEYSESPYLSWLITGVPVEFLNPVFKPRLLAEEVDGALQELNELYVAHQVTKYTWWLDPDSEPDDLADRLTAHGLALDTFTPAMAADLRDLADEQQARPGLSVRRVENDNQLAEWVRTCCRSFDLPETAENTLFDLLVDQGVGLPVGYYTALLDGKPLATAMMLLAEGVVGIYCVGAVREARGQGLGTAVTLAPLLDAREIGYGYGVLQSSRAGFNVYKRLGFRKVGEMQCYYSPQS